MARKEILTSPEVHASDSFINTIYVDPSPYSCRVTVSRDGFQPHTVTLAKHESVLWTWDSIPDEQHNIFLIKNPSDQNSIVPARGPAFFESGPLTSQSTFFHTFDTPGSYWVTSHGTEGKSCRVVVLNEAKRVMYPTITNGSDGGNVELGYTVFLSCVDSDVDILYTLDGSMPIDKLPNSKIYDCQEGIRLSRAGLYLVRARAIKAGWIPSEIFTSRRFWVLPEEEVDDASAANEQSMEDNLGLRQEITNWQWASCAPIISSTFVFDNVIRIDFILSPNAQPSWIAGFQLFLNGQPYGGWLCASCPGVEVSGLTGGKVYHVVIVVFPAQQEFSPQLSNQLIITCPAVSSFGGPVISLETCDRVDALVIVWPAKQDTVYTLLVDGQPMGEQVSAEPDNDYCRVLFERESVEEERIFTIMTAIGENPQLVSNEIQFSLPLPMEIIQTNRPTFDQQNNISPTPQDPNPSTSPTNVSKELLIVSELSVAVIPGVPDSEPALFPPDPPQFQTTLDTIPEDKQLVVVSPSRRSTPSEYTEDVIREENSQQLEVDGQDKTGNSNQSRRDAVEGEEGYKQENNDENMKGVHAEDKQLVVVSPSRRSPPSVYTEDVTREENSQQLEADGQDKTGNRNLSRRDAVEGEEGYKQENNDENMKGVHAEGSITNRSGTEGNDKILTEVHPEEHDLQEHNTNSVVDGIYGPPVEYSDDTNPLEWECVYPSNCDYYVDYIEEDSQSTDGPPNIRSVESQEIRTKNIVSSTNADMHEECHDLKFYSCEVCNFVSVEITQWRESYGVRKEIECFEEILNVVEQSAVFGNVAAQNEMLQSVDADIRPLIRDLEIPHGIAEQTMEDGHRTKEISLEEDCVGKAVATTTPLDVQGDEEEKKKASVPEEKIEGSDLDDEMSLVNRECLLTTPAMPDVHVQGVVVGDNTKDYEKDGPSRVLTTQLSSAVTLAVKGTAESTVILEWEDRCGIDLPLYHLLVFGDTFNSEVDSQYRYSFKDSPTPDIWPSNKTTTEQHCWPTENKVIEIRGLKPRHRYRITVVIIPREKPVNHCSDGISFPRTEILMFTMPGRPKAPVIYVTALRDREFTISWRPPCSYGGARIVGYRLLVNGNQHGELLAHDAVHHTISDLQYGTFNHISLVAVTNLHVGDSTQSNVVTIACPQPPPPPEIREIPSPNLHTICITWSAINAPNNPDQLQLLSSYDVFVNDVFHGSCPVGDVTDIFMDSFTYTIPGCITGREYSIKVKGHVDPQAIESSQPAHMCSCYGEPSNTLLVGCFESTSGPVLHIKSMSESAVHLWWEKPLVPDTLQITGYLLRVNGRNHGSAIKPDFQEAELSNLPLGSDIEVTLLTLTSNADALGDVRRQGQRHLESPINVEAQTQEPHDSGVESSSSTLVDQRSGPKFQSAPLTLHLWEFVKKVCDVQIKQVCCCSALVQWSLQSEEMDHGRRHVFIEPEVFKVKCWKSEDFSLQELEPIETPKLTIHLQNLTPSSRYGVVIEAFAHHPNYSETNADWNVSRSDKIWFDTNTSSNSLEDVRVLCSTVNSICLAWDLTSDESIKDIELKVYRKYVGNDDNGDGDNHDVTSFAINPHMTSYTVHNLDAKTTYIFTLKPLYLNDRQCCGEDVSLEACTSGVDRPRGVHVIKRTPFSLDVAWQPAVSYGYLDILYYLVHCIEKKIRSLQCISDANFVRIPHSSAVGPQATIADLEPGVEYCITVEAVVGLHDAGVELRDKDVEKDAEDGKQVNNGDEVESSIGSSESDWVPSVGLDCLSMPLTASTAAPPGVPVLFVTGISATQIHLAWNKPVALRLQSDDQGRAERQECRGRVRQINGYSLEVNGRVITKLAPDKHSFSLKRCKPGMKYTCCLVVLTTAGESGGKRSKKTEGLEHKLVTAVSTTDIESDDETDTSFQESRSEPVEVTIPRQDHPLAITIHYIPTSSNHVPSISSSGSEESDDGCVVVEWKASAAMKGVVSYQVKWRSSFDEVNEDSVMPSSKGYEIYPVKQRSIYTVWLRMVSTDGSSISWGPLLCQVPGRPEPPWIWCRTVSSHRILVEWNEPQMYGVDTIRAYQVNLNGRQLGKLLSPQRRKVAVHCQPSSVYRIVLLALSTDPNLGSSDPSNLLTICTPGVKDKSLDPKQNIRIKPLWAENDSITVEWSDDNDILAVDHYIIKWSSVLHPQSKEKTLPVSQVSYTIEDCIPGTRHFIAVAAVDDQGKLVSKSQQLTIQTSAPLAAPKLRRSSSLAASIQVEWNKPIAIGDATVHAYEIKVNNIVQATVGGSEISFEWKDCAPCVTYDFQIKVISTKEDCHSNWSDVLSVTCPGAFVPVITRAPSSYINAIHVVWNTPDLVGGATIESYKVHYLVDQKLDLTNHLIVTSPSTITHGPLDHTTHDDTLDNGLPTLPYWVTLEVNLIPEWCSRVFSQPIRTKVAVPPDPPQISVEVKGLNERRALERFVCGLAQVKDRICMKLQTLQKTVVVKGSKHKETQICKNFAAIRKLEVELKNCTQDIKDLTGSVNANIKWSQPRDDGDATVTGYQILVDGEEHGVRLNKSVLSTSLELPASPQDHVIRVKTLTNHPVGPSGPSNAVTVCAKDFLPFVHFCYFDVHSESTGCCYEQSLAHEMQNKLISTHRGSLEKPLPSPVWNVTNVVNLCSKPLLTFSDKPRAVLFWTIWCYSSIKAIEVFIQFANEFSHKFDFTTCCVNSGQPASTHHQSLHNLLTSHGWIGRSTEVQHTCGCHANNNRPSFQRSVGIGEKCGVSHVFGLVGVPTIVLCNKQGYVIWQGRCCTQDYSEYQQFMCHALSEASGQPCTVANCTQCSLDHELDTMDINGPFLQTASDPSDCYRYKKTKRDSSLEVTGWFSRARQKRLSLVDGDKTGSAGPARGGKIRTSLENLHPSVIEETENLHRRLHGTHLDDITPQTTRPQTPKSSTCNNSKTLQNSSPQSVRFLAPDRAKSASYQTRTSMFQDRFSPSMASTLPSLGLTTEKTKKKTRSRSAVSKPKQKISVDKFSPI